MKKTRKKCNANYTVCGLEQLERWEIALDYLAPYNVFVCFERSKGLILCDEYFYEGY